MFDFMEPIYHALLSVPYLFVSLLVTSINGWISALGAIINALVFLLPSFPAVPDIEGELLGVVNWFFPVGAFLVFFSGLLVTWGAFLAIKVGLNWGKVNV